jgi:hypothetical protein
MFNNFNFFSKQHILTNFLCKTYQSNIKKIIMILKDFFEDFLKNILGIFLQKQSQSR